MVSLESWILLIFSEFIDSARIFKRSIRSTIGERMNTQFILNYGCTLEYSCKTNSQGTHQGCGFGFFYSCRKHFLLRNNEARVAAFFWMSPILFSAGHAIIYFLVLLKFFTFHCIMRLTLIRKNKKLSAVLGEKWIFLTSFSFLTCIRWEMNISHHFKKIRSKCEIFSPTFTREEGPISCLSWEKQFFHTLAGKNSFLHSLAGKNSTLCNKGGKLTFSSEDDDWARVIHECSKSSSETEKVNCSLVIHSNFFNKCRNRTFFAWKVNRESCILIRHSVRRSIFPPAAAGGLDKCSKSSIFDSLFYAEKGPFSCTC